MARQIQPPTPDQIDILGWTASLGAVTAEALAFRLDVSVACARARLSVAERRGMLSRERPLAGRPALFTVTRLGLRESGARGMGQCRVAPHGAQHLMACAAAAAALERCYPDHRLLGERELRRDERDLGRPIASATLRACEGLRTHVHRPDLVLWPADPDGRPVAVEIELTVKAPRRLAEICRAWARCRAVAGVLYLAPPSVERALVRAVRETHAGGRIAILGLDALPGMETVSGWTSALR